MRAVLLARATVTSIRGLRASIRASHDPSAAPRWLAHRTTALAPRMSRRRMVRSPIFEMAPLRDGPQFALAAGRLLQRRQPEPGGEVPPGAEALRRRHQRGD